MNVLSKLFDKFKKREYIKFEVPSRETLEYLESVGVDFEQEAIRAFAQELHRILTGEDSIIEISKNVIDYNDKKED